VITVGAFEAKTHLSVLLDKVAGGEEVLITKHGKAVARLVGAEPAQVTAPSAFVLDCSIAMAWCFEDEAGAETDRLLERLRDQGGRVPSLWFWEVANVLNGAIRRGRLAPAQATARLALLAALPIEIDAEGASRAWRETLMLAQAHDLTVYDAAYLELASRYGADLATSDKALRTAGAQLGLTVIP
jgi:prevent-host-death family protein